MATDVRKNLKNFFSDLYGPIIVFDIETIPDEERIIKFYTNEELSEKESLYQVSIGFHKIIAISYCKVHFDKKLRTFDIKEPKCIFDPESEKNVLLRFAREILPLAEEHSAKFVTFNGNNYDLPVIEKRCLYLGLSNSYENEDERWHLKDLYFLMNQLQNQPWKHLDLFWLLNMRGQKGGMSFLADLMGESKLDDMKGFMVHELFKTQDYDKIKEYSLKDAKLEAQLFVEVFNFLKP